MSERKDINKLFQEKFENFEITPDEMVWKNIEIELKEKKKRRIIPFWWKLSGIAAALLIGFFVYTINYKSSISIENGVVNQEQNNSDIKGKSVNKTIETSSKPRTTENNNNETVISNSKKENIAVSNDNSKVKESKTNKIGVTNYSNESLAVSNNTSKTSSNKNKTALNNQNKTNTSLVSSEKAAIKNISEKQNKTTNTAIIQNNSEDKIAYHSSKQRKARLKNSSTVVDNNNSLAVKSDENKNKTTVNKTTVSLPNKESKTSVADNNNATINKNKSVLNPNDKTDETMNKKIDSTKIATVEPNALEELLNEKESKSITEPKLNRWQVSSNVAPIYFSSISKGSPLDDGLKNNDKSYGANNQSYGIGVNYALNKKLKVRTGVNILNVDYNTNGIAYYQTQSVNGKLTNLNPNLIGSSIMIENLSNVDTPFNKSVQKSEGSLNQKLGYIEMPLEITYKVLDKKLGIDFIGGMSTMILNRNEIYLQSSELNLKIGEANNLNNVHFSGNVGLGFKYDIFRRVEARIEPVF